MGELLLVTGELAEGGVRKAAARLGADVLALPVSVAQFMSPKLAAKGIKDLDSRYKRIILPGLARFDAAELEELVGMPCFKGPVHASDLAEVLEKGLKLSKKEPADCLLQRRGLKDYREAAAKAEREEERFRIGKLKIGQGFPPRIVAEIVDAPLLTDEQALERARYYLKSGADIIDVGAVAAEGNPDRLAELVRLLKRRTKAPVSIDSLDPEEINAGLRNGADLVLSLNAGNMEAVEVWPHAAYVVIPDGGNETLFHNLKEAEKLGFGKLIADPILAPPFKTIESLSHYHEFRQLYHAHPLMMGTSNVVELIDADSVGMNGLLAAMAAELDASLLLTTENSQKTRNSVRELKRGVEMAFLARRKGALPKDLGFDLLLAKGKGKGMGFEFEDAEVVPVSEEAPGFKADPKGHFRISVDFNRGLILAAHARDGHDCVFEGSSAEAVSKKIIERGMVSSLEHAAYLGRELQKAEMYLKLRRGYVQDEDFPGL